MKVVQRALPDGHIIPGNNREIFAYYGLDDTGLSEEIRRQLQDLG